jgi:uncharacterized membrane protein YkvA (DUF1232 family)
MNLKNEDFYKSMRERIRVWLAKKGKHYRYADFLLFAPDLFHLISKLVLDERIPVRHKARLGAAIAYFVSPVDLIPEAVVGPVGYIDDIILAAYPDFDQKKEKLEGFCWDTEKKGNSWALHLCAAMFGHIFTKILFFNGLGFTLSRR